MSSAITLLASIEYADKSNEELTKIFVDLSKRAAALPATQSSLTALEEIKDRMEAINAIKASRAEEVKKVSNAEKKWKDDREASLQNAWQNLPYSSSANGQLIAAILEDEPGLTVSQIAAWCDELAVMETTDVENILNEMVKEGCLRYELGQYFLRQLCTEKLIPENPAETAGRKLTAEDVWWYNTNRETVMGILQTLEREGSALNPQTIQNRMSRSSEVKLRDIERLCDRLKDEEILVEDEINGVSLYYFPTMGLTLYDKPEAGTAFSEEKYVKSNAQYSNRNSSSSGRRPSVRQIENDKLKQLIIKKMREQADMGRIRLTIPEILGLIETNDITDEVSQSRCSALVSQLIDEERLERWVDQKVANFSLK